MTNDRDRRLVAALGPLAAAAIAAVLAGCGGGNDGSTPEHAQPPQAQAEVQSQANGQSLARPSDGATRIEVLSTQPHLISGGDALVRVTLPPGIAEQAVTIRAAGRDMTDRFQRTGAGTLLGVVDGLPVGESTIDVQPENAQGLAASLKVRNWPITGPIISGPHQEPYFCQTEEFVLPDATTLGAALDENCSVATRVHYLYRPQGSDALEVLPTTAQLPSNVATTTTLSGKTVPFVVRVETGTVSRGIYQSALLHDPTSEEDPTPLAPPKGWNKRLVAIQGFGCPGGWYRQGGSQGNISIAGFGFTLLNMERLGEGYAMFANTLHHASNNCNAVLASEAAMMSKERFIETIGLPQFTVSAGCSGGSYGSAQPADRIPGLFDGILIMCTFPDPLSIAFTGSDGHLLTNFLYQTNEGVFTDEQILAITGHKTVKAFTDAANQAGRTDPVPNREDFEGYNSAPFHAIVPESIRYHPVNNPTGIRGTVYDAARNIYGVSLSTQAALRPFDNVGVQYGLEAVNKGAISVDQFLLLNEKVGGYDQNANYVAQRSVGDPDAMRRAMQSGLQLGGNGGLASIPVFDVTGIYNEDASYHYQWFHFALRDRMEQLNGDAENHVMWRGSPVPAERAWDEFIDWVASYKADSGPGTQREKVIRHKPITDGCWSDESTFIEERQTLSSEPDSQCNRLFPSWTFPREVAGGPVAANIMKCSLKSVDAADYDVQMSSAQLDRLRAIFPEGVCDWSKPGNLTGVVPFGSFGPSPKNLVFDITGLCLEDTTPPPQ